MGDDISSGPYGMKMTVSSRRVLFAIAPLMAAILIAARYWRPPREKSPATLSISLSGNTMGGTWSVKLNQFPLRRFPPNA